MSRTQIRVAGAWVDLPSGVPGPPGPIGPAGSSGNGGVLLGHIDSVLVAGVGSTKIYNDRGATVTIATIRASVINPPLGGPLTFDINLNGTTIFTTQANRPSIAAGAYTSGIVVPDDTTWGAGEALTVDVDLIGTSYAGAYATIQIGLV